MELVTDEDVDMDWDEEPVITINQDALAAPSQDIREGGGGVRDQTRNYHGILLDGRRWRGEGVFTRITINQDALAAPSQASGEHAFPPPSSTVEENAVIDIREGGGGVRGQTRNYHGILLDGRRWRGEGVFTRCLARSRQGILIDAVIVPGLASNAAPSLSDIARPDPSDIARPDPSDISGRAISEREGAALEARPGTITAFSSTVDDGGGKAHTGCPC
jgi:hypothetical protein